MVALYIWGLLWLFSTNKENPDFNFQFQVIFIFSNKISKTFKNEQITKTQINFDTWEIQQNNFQALLLILLKRCTAKTITSTNLKFCTKTDIGDR